MPTSDVTVNDWKAHGRGAVSGKLKSKTAGSVTGSHAPRKREPPCGSAPASSCAAETQTDHRRSRVQSYDPLGPARARGVLGARKRIYQKAVATRA